MKKGKIHFIGICGAGMSAVATLLKEEGWDISGSDEAFYPPVSTYLEHHNIAVSTPHNPSNIPQKADYIVIGKHAKLTKENPEVAAAYESGIPVRSYPEVLGNILKSRSPLIVAGSYGKSTVSAMLAWCLLHAGKDPGYFIGAIPKNIDATSHLGVDSEFVVEGDEYPSSNTDPRSKFFHYRAHDLLVTAAVHDHANVFPTQEDFLVPFQELVGSLPADGLFVVCVDEPHARSLTDLAPCRSVSYSLHDTSADYYASAIRYGEVSSCTLLHRGMPCMEITTQLLGAHNMQNIVGACALLLEKNLLTPKEITSALESFEGITRRLDKKTGNSRVPAYEGFGSSYEKARSAIEAMRLHFPKHKLAVVFEPHTFSWRNRNMLHWYDSVFAGAERVFVYHPPAHGALSHDQLSHEEILERTGASGIPTIGLTDPEAGVQSIVDALTEDHIVLLLTSGDLGGMMQTLPQALDELFV